MTYVAIGYNPGKITGINGTATTLPNKNKFEYFCNIGSVGLAI